MIEIQRNEVHLWCVYDQELTDKTVLQQYETLLSAEERARWQRFKFPQHRHQFLVTRALVRSVLAEYLEIKNPADIDFTKNHYSKPALNVSGQSSAIKFNISHTEELIVLAVSLETEIGVDIETIGRKAEFIQLAQRYFSPQESKALIALKTERQNERFFDLWTLKEAYIKACGKGLALPLQDFSYDLDEQDIGISFSGSISDSPQAWHLWLFDLSEKHRLALALKDENGLDYSVIWNKGVPLQGFTHFNQDYKMRSASLSL